MVHKRSLIAVILVIFFTSSVAADVVVLKNGRRLEGAIVGEAPDSITIDIGIGETTLSKSDIKNIERNKEKNAAIYYLRAVDLADYGAGSAGKNRIAQFEKSGFRMDSAELKKLLDSNARCLDEVGKGLGINTCDFYFEYKYNSAGPSSRKENQRDIMYLHSLLLLKGRYQESLKSPDRAVDAYLSALTFARQISQGPDSEFKTAGIIVEKNTLPILMGYLNAKDADPKICKKISAYLKDYEKTHFSAKEFFESCKEAFLQPFNSFALSVTRWARTDPKRTEETAVKAQKFSEDLLREANALADRYYGNFIKAAGSNDGKDWDFAVKEYDDLVKDVKPPDIEDEIDMAVFADKTFGNLEEYDKKDPKNIAITLLNAELPSDRAALGLYRENRNRSAAIKALASRDMKLTE